MASSEMLAAPKIVPHCHVRYARLMQYGVSGASSYTEYISLSRTAKCQRCSPSSQSPDERDTMFNTFRKLLFPRVDDRPTTVSEQMEMTGIAIGALDTTDLGMTAEDCAEDAAGTSIRQCRNLEPFDDVGPNRRCRAALLDGDTQALGQFDSCFGNDTTPWRSWQSRLRIRNEGNIRYRAVILIEHPNKTQMSCLQELYKFDDKFLERYADIAANVHHRKTFMGGKKWIKGDNTKATFGTTKSESEENWDFWTYEQVLELDHRSSNDLVTSNSIRIGLPTDGEHWFAFSIACYRPSSELRT